MTAGNTGNKNDGELVYSTEGGRVKPERVEQAGPTGSGRDVRVELSRSGRKGKTVTVISGLPPGELRGVAKELKRLCGAGGAVKDGAVEIQGDQRERVVQRLSQRYRVSGA